MFEGAELGADLVDEVVERGLVWDCNIIALEEEGGGTGYGESVIGGLKRGCSCDC